MKEGTHVGSIGDLDPACPVEAADSRVLEAVALEIAQVLAPGHLGLGEVLDEERNKVSLDGSCWSGGCEAVTRNDVRSALFEFLLAPPHHAAPGDRGEGRGRGRGAESESSVLRSQARDSK